MATTPRQSWRENFGFLVNRLSARMQQAFEEQLAPHKITRLQWAVLRDLCDEPHRPAQLAAKVGCDRSVMTRVLEGLQRRGLITRTIAAQDRRNVDVALTDTGRQLVAKLIGVAGSVNETFLRGLTKQQAEGLTQALLQILNKTEKQKEDVA
jgi:MarR family transcriptional regulator for hemolysin